MKTPFYKTTTLVFLLFCLLCQAHPGLGQGRYTKEKTLKREFQVTADALLKINNDYGNLNITTWDQNKVVMEITIKTNGDHEERVERKLEEIEVVFDASPSLVQARTTFGERNSWGWNWGRNNDKVNMQVHYTIKMPVKNRVDLSNDYGTIFLDRLDGHAKISCDYGRLEIGQLNGRNNELYFDYTSKSMIEFMASGEIRADYSDVTVERAGDLRLVTDYTNVTVGEMDDLEYSSDYGKITVNEVKNVQGNGDYITVSLGLVQGSVDITADYGSVRIGEMSEGAGDLILRTDYTGIRIGYHPNYHFTFDINTQYAGVSGMDAFILAVQVEKNAAKRYEGHYGQPTANSHVRLSSEYGSIRFTQK
ncbi:hypothetical protein [Maribacter sp. 2307ULW6-5]|uniref:hypothetical protein n=1 Tax=Maribacter sp. 2307ULW6-5 TaxID=3386275 RepID=UPI0039BC46A3